MWKWLTGLLHETLKGFRAKVAERLAAFAFVVLLAAAALVPRLPLWHWFLAIDPELARQVAFILLVLLGLLVLFVPRRGLPIKVRPVRERGEQALILVSNDGEHTSFYSGMEILEVKQPGMIESRFRRLSLRPTWLAAVSSSNSALLKLLFYTAYVVLRALGYQATGDARVDTCIAGSVFVRGDGDHGLPRPRWVLERAVAITGYASTRTTQLFDRRRAMERRAR
jgi:hypothetical protein